MNRTMQNTSRGGRLNNNFTNMEFFKATYFEMKLDRKKMMRVFKAKDDAADELELLQKTKRGDFHQPEERCVSISPDNKDLR